MTIQPGQITFSKIDDVTYGKSAAQAVAETVARLGAKRVFLMVSGTLKRETDEIAKVRGALGDTCAGTFDAMPPHTPRGAVIAAAAKAREGAADLIATFGGGGRARGIRQDRGGRDEDAVDPAKSEADSRTGGRAGNIGEGCVRRTLVLSPHNLGSFAA